MARQDDGKVGVKCDGGKERFDLIPARPLLYLAQVYTYGAGKYADRNWENGIAWGRIFAAIMRHLWKFWLGEYRDEESGLPHLAHAAWGCFTLLEYQHTKREFDDRPEGQTYGGFLEEGGLCDRPIPRSE